MSCECEHFRAPQWAMKYMRDLETELERLLFMIWTLDNAVTNKDLDKIEYTNNIIHTYLNNIVEECDKDLARRKQEYRDRKNSQ